MLSQVRDTLKGVVAYIVVGLLIVAFAAFGVPELANFTSGSTVKVGNESFSQQYIVNEFDQLYQRRARESGGALSREDAIASGMPTQVIDMVTTQSAIAQYAEKMNLAIPREAVREYLQNNESFQNPATGQFDRLMLDTILQNNSLTVSGFEQIIKEDLTRSQLVESVAASGPAPDPFTEALLLRETERRNIAYITVTDEMAGVAAEPTPADIEQFYNENESVFTSPEYRTFDMLVLRDDDFREGLEVPEEEMRRLYDLGKERLYDKPEKRSLYQLTFQDEAEANAAVASLRQGEPFENLAQARGMTLDAATLDDASAIVDPSVSSAALAEGLNEGDVPDPIRSLFGWTVIQIANIEPAETTTFEEVRDELAADYLAQDIRRRMQDAIDEIEEVRDTGAELDEAAEAAGFSVVSVGPVDRLSFAPGGAIISDIPGEVLEEAFNLEEGEQSEALRLSEDDGYFFVALREVTPPALQPLDYVRDDAEQRWRDRERRQRISNTVTLIRNEVESGKSFEEVADQFSRAPIVTTIDRRFQNEVISPSFNEQIFFANKGDLVSAPAGSSGAQVVAEIRAIGYGRNQIAPQEVEQIRQMFGFQLDQELLEAFVLSIRDDMGVKVNNDQIEALFRDGY
ncbi:SurA N-terminal domain-containing protein [Hyphococcus sp. DH-69]|uniref:SurA N-terminal domain-containing protein n=1 Tax=Hyphococcus formosus TaxID=3143534 RepID=UPI00398B0B7C